MTFRLSRRSLSRLEDVHPKLVAVVKRAIQITEIDFGVTEGLRSIATQRAYVKRGVSWTMRSFHLRQASGYAHAVDLVAYLGPRITWEPAAYVPIGEAMKQAAKELGVPLTWGAQKKYGGDWNRTNDMPHFQVPRSLPVE